MQNEEQTMESPSDRLSSRCGRRPAIALALSLVGALVAAGCSSPASSAAGGTIVKVTLTEWAVVLDKASVPSGDVKFEVTNAGTQFKHELVVLKSDLDPANVPADSTGKVDEEGTGVTWIGEVAEMDTGSTQSVSINLAAGKYVLLCNIVEAAGNHESHYHQGMRIAFTVT
jgi:hypothetical protein